MDVLKTFFREHPEAWRITFFVAGIAGLGNAAILAIINRAASLTAADGGGVGFRLLALFALCITAFYFGKRYSLIRASVMVEHVVRDRFDRVADKIRRSELQVIENLGRGELYTKLTQDTSIVSQAGLILVNAAQQAFLLTFCLLYIAALSRPAFAVTLLTIGIGSSIYRRHARALEALLVALSLREAHLVDSLAHLVDGFKELRLSSRKSEAAFASFQRVSGGVRDLRIDVQISSCVDIMFSDLFFYFLLFTVTFLLPRLLPAYSIIVSMTTAAILFIIGPLQMVVQAVPVLEHASAALKGLFDLESQLDRSLSDSGVPAPPSVELFSGFRTLTFEGVRFSYDAQGGSDNGFSVGPLDLRLDRGEVVFLVGGNGSGKTTTLKLLTGLYLPQSGAIKVDQVLLTRSNIQGYRELFSTVFAQFHLFDQLYGLEVDEARVAAVLQEMELTEKTRFENGRFSDLNLSTGQRKRLALAVCLLEDKEILVFDEWAADQDPHFRRYFYEDVLRRMKAQGKTVVAATHDDRYWHVADRVLRMEFGVLVEEMRNR